MSRDKSSYHHKDLRNTLIEKGIELVNTEGIKAFSLRKAAAACGVSHAAPYSHFQSKEELLEAMQQHITDQFSKTLEMTIKQSENDTELLKLMGKAYVSFFIENPHYFSFIYSQTNLKIDLTTSISDEDNYMPFVIYKNMVISLLEKTRYPKEKYQDVVIAMWAFIHGITSLATMNKVFYDKDWKQKVNDFMDIFEITFLKGLEE